MEVTYKILYRNGFEDEIKANVDEESVKGYHELYDTIKHSFTEDVAGHIRIVDKNKSIHTIKLQDVIRVSIKEEDDNQ